MQEYLGLKLYGFIAYLSFPTVTRLLVRPFQNWDSFKDSSLVIPAMVLKKKVTADIPPLSFMWR